MHVASRTVFFFAAVVVVGVFHTADGAGLRLLNNPAKLSPLQVFHKASAPKLTEIKRFSDDKLPTLQLFATIDKLPQSPALDFTAHIPVFATTLAGIAREETAALLADAGIIAFPGVVSDDALSAPYEIALNAGDLETLRKIFRRYYARTHLPPPSGVPSAQSSGAEGGVDFGNNQPNTTP